MNSRAFALLMTVVGCTLSAVSAQTSATHKAVSKKAVTKSATGKKAAAGSTTTAGKKGSPSAKKRPVTNRIVAAPRQSAPSPDRYKEIQNALAAKGYLKSEPTGVWDAESMDAMKRFQMDQKQDPTGKLTAASLIGLGLGPRTALISTAAVNPAEVPAPQP